MKTAHETSKGSEVRHPWRCYAIWWMDALALLVIMLVMSARKVFLQQAYTHRLEERRDHEDHDSEWEVAHSVA